MCIYIYFICFFYIIIIIIIRTPLLYACTSTSRQCCASILLAISCLSPRKLPIARPSRLNFSITECACVPCAPYRCNRIYIISPYLSVPRIDVSHMCVCEDHIVRLTVTFLIRRKSETKHKLTN